MAKYCIALASLILLVQSCRVAGQESGLDQSDLDGIQRMTDEWLEAHASRDWEKLATHYTEDAILMPPFAAIIQGQSNIRDWFAANENFTTIHVEILEIEGYEDLAYVRGISTVTLHRTGQTPVTFAGKYLDIRRRSVDGNWRVSLDMFSPDQPVE